MTDEDLMKAINEATDDQLADVVTSLLFPGILAATRHGVPLQKALRGVIALYFERTLDSAVWKELGVPQRTAERWRSELRDVLSEAPEIQGEVPTEILETYARLKLQKLAKDQRKAG